jgi:hypothetical protein
MKTTTLALILALAAAGAAHATERGQIRAVNGAAGAEISSPQFPGLYGQFWLQQYTADTFKDANGNNPVTRLPAGPLGSVLLERGGKVDATAFVPRLTWLTDKRLGEGKFGISAALPLVQIDQQVRFTARPGDALVPQQVIDAAQAQGNALAARSSGKQSGLGDMEVMPYIDWQTDTYRYAFGLGVVAPTGDYDAKRAVNTGTGNFWTIRPLAVGSYVFESGIEMGVRATYSFNTRNKDTDNKSGEYFAADYSVHYKLSDSWKLGAQGFANIQTTHDRCAADTTAALATRPANNCGLVRAYGLGPVGSWTSEDGRVFVDFKVLREFAVQNRPQGTVFWLRANFRLDQ